MLKFDKNGNYRPGIHKVGYGWLHKNLVEDFKDSKTRARNLEFFKKFCKMYTNIDYFNFVWIDGSFCTNKMDPNDVDAIFIHTFNIDDSGEWLKDVELYGRLQEQFKTIKEKNLDRSFYSDVYMMGEFNITDNSSKSLTTDQQQFLSNLDFHKKYWMGQFTFDRAMNPKGIFQIDRGEFND